MVYTDWLERGDARGELDAEAIERQLQLVERERRLERSYSIAARFGAALRTR